MMALVRISSINSSNIARITLSILFLNAHTSHLVQPLDLAVFNVSKHYHSEIIKIATATGCTKFQKTDFLIALSSIQKKTFTPHTIKLGFRLAGIWPFNPAIICEKMVYYQPETLQFTTSSLSSSSQSVSSMSSYGTPTTIRKIQKLKSSLLKNGKAINDYTLAIQKLAKAAQLNLYQLKEAHQDIEMTKATSLRQNERYNLTRTSIRSRGIISAQNLQKMKRDKAKLTELEAIDKLRPKRKKVMEELKRECRRTGPRLGR